MSWRKIETALVHVCRAYGLTVDDNGDKFAKEALCLGETIEDLNLTELAKDLERELAP